MFFTPFAFVQQPFAVTVATSTLQGYYFGGSFTGYGTATNQPYFRMLDSSGSISSSFNIGTGFSNSVNGLVLQPDGKIVAVGVFTAFSGSAKGNIVRLNTNGTADTGSSWNQGSGFNSTTTGIAIQSDGKLVVTGVFSGYSGSGATRIARLNTNGTIDTGSSWNSGAGFNNSINDLKIQADQKIVVVGSFTTYSGSGATRIARINTNGTADTGSSWNTGTAFGATSVNCIAIQPDQKIVIGGSFTSYSGSGATRIARLNVSGTIDTGSSWNSGTGFNSTVQTVAIQSDGKLVVGGDFLTYSGSGATRIARLNVSGTIDTGSSWNTGRGFNSTVNAITIQPDQKIIARGVFTAYSGSIANGIVRLNTDGTLDTTFNRALSIDSTATTSVVVLPNSSIVLGGTFGGNRVSAATFLDTTGNTGSRSTIGNNGLNISVSNMATQSDGKVILVGGFANYSGSTVNSIIRVNPDGTLDSGSSWNTGGGFVGNSVPGLLVQPDQKIVVGGNFSTYSGSAVGRIVRINPNGTVDTGSSWNTGGGFNSNVNSIARQADGKLVVGGIFATYSGSGATRIARLNVSGTLDSGSSWNSGAGFDNTVNTLLIQPDQKIIATGIFLNYSSSGAGGIARINTNGTADTGSSWNTGAGVSPAAAGVFASAIQSDGKILIGGSFTSYSGSGATRIARLNVSGTIDSGSSWNTGTGFNSVVGTIALEADSGKVLVGGQFTAYSGSTRNRIVRLNSNGTVDTTFVPPGSGFNATGVNIILPILS